MLKGS
jgi:hypothetical protein